MPEKQKSIYILAVADVVPLTDDDLKKRYEFNKIMHPGLKQDFEAFKRFLEEWGDREYSISTFDTAYFEEESVGIEYATLNMADINEAGAYPYLCLYSRPINTMYADTDPCTCRVFHFNRDTGCYDEITDLSADRAAAFLRKRFDCMFDLQKR